MGNVVRGVDLDRLQLAYDLLDAAVVEGAIPGAVALIGVDADWLPAHATGLAVSTAEHRHAARPDTIYDLASLTKVVATLPAVLVLVQAGLMDLNSPISADFPELPTDTDWSGVTLRRLLAHTSGLPAWRDLHSHGWSHDRILNEVLATPLESEPGTHVVYSDLGYILLGEWVRRVTGEGIDTWTQRELYVPLGMNDTAYRPGDDLRERIAAGEHREHLGRHQWGEVNDDNAYALGGVSGHAGLYSTAGDLARYIDACWLPWRAQPCGLLAPATVRDSLRCHTEGLDGRRGLGWVLKGDDFDHTGKLMSMQTFGHTGYTGTSLAIDPERRLKVVLLTNRVHSDSKEGIADLRRRFHDAVTEAVA